jgi:hypothetical protein
MTALTLPEFVFLDSSYHEPKDIQINKRTILMHVKSATVIEVFDGDDEFALDPEIKTYQFAYKNRFNAIEDVTLAVHFSYADNEDEVLKAAAIWYADYCDWEDGNIAGERLRNSN